MIKKGIIQSSDIYGTPFQVDLIPRENKSSRPALPMTPTNITVHETGNESQSADARMHTTYVDNTRNYVSWHFTVDDSIIIQELPILENAWHAGDGPRGKGNRTSIAIEICVNKGGNFDKAKENAIKLINYLKENQNTIGVIYQHNHWNGKNCPNRIRKSGWDKFLNRVESYIPPTIKKWPVPDWAVEAWQWSVDIGINDGIVQSKEEIKTVVMIHRYHEKFIKPLYEMIGGNNGH